MMNVEQIRADTPGCTDTLFLNSAGSSLMPESVVQTMKDYLDQEARWGGYEVARQRADDLEEFYAEAAHLINASPQQIAYVYHATDAYSRALSAVPLSSGDTILTTNDDYISNQIAFLSLQKRWGVQIVRARNLPGGDLDLDDVERQIQTHHPKLVAVTHVPTNSGLIQPAEAIGAICRKHGCWYLLDACQSVGQLPVDAEAIGCDFLSATGRKFLRGPRGSGFLYVSERVIQEKLEPLFIDMRGADWVEPDDYRIRMSAQRFETWEQSYVSLIGLTEALRYANQIGMANIDEYNQRLSQQLRAGIANIPSLRGLDRGSQLASIVTFTQPDTPLGQMEARLKENKVLYSVSTADSALIDFARKGATWAIRLSPHYFNTNKEIETVLDILSSTA